MRFLLPLHKIQIPINLLAVLDENDAGFVGVFVRFLAHMDPTPSLSWASVSCQRRAPQSEINAFIFYSGNNFDEICFTQWCLNQSANQGHWVRGCRSVMEMMEKTSDQEKSKCGCFAFQRGRINSSWLLQADDDDLKISFCCRITCMFWQKASISVTW